MSSENELKEGNIQQPEENEGSGEIGLKKDLLDSTVRFSFCENTTKEELEYCLQQLKELLMVLRRYSRH